MRSSTSRSILTGIHFAAAAALILFCILSSTTSSSSSFHSSSFSSFVSAQSPSPPTSNANLLVNGDFEDPHLPLHTFQNFRAADGFIPGWTEITGCGIEIQSHAGGEPDPVVGLDQFVELDSDCSSKIIQNVATQVGSIYKLSFYYSPRPFIRDNYVGAYWDGQLLGSQLQMDGSQLTETVWRKWEFQVVATRSLSELMFAGEGSSDGFSGYVDHVELMLMVLPDGGGSGEGEGKGDGEAEYRPGNKNGNESGNGSGSESGSSKSHTPAIVAAVVVAALAVVLIGVFIYVRLRVRSAAGGGDDLAIPLSSYFGARSGGEDADLAAGLAADAEHHRSFWNRSIASPSAPEL